ncbi:LuxR family transcriptional regulator [Microbacterium awajiense]|uniref:LuxR family transcriptional regulator n=1 Tax=Microbacterium awajiense TaxID=415214 RepID=A0ABP7AR90_9MICO
MRIGAQQYRDRIDDTRMLGRAAELDRLRALFSGARNGVGGALLVEGDPGIGKTTLIDEALADQSWLRVIRAQGVDVEAAIPYGALQRLGRALSGYAEDIPETQRAALRVAVGLDDGNPPQTPLVGLGTLSVLARAADDKPTVCIVDDAQQVDAESLLVIGFVARRLSAESACVVVASRPDERVARLLAGVPRLELGGLDGEDAAVLLRGAVDGELDPTIAADYVQYTGGNPLALRELAAEWSADELTASALAHSPVPIGRRLDQIYSARLSELPEQTRAWLLLAATESTGDLEAVGHAAAEVGVDPASYRPAEAIDFVTVRDQVTFRHPLIRSAVYAAAGSDERRRAHRALSLHARENDRIELAAWHAAAAVDGLDPQVADEVAAAADLAASRGGVLSRAHLMARAAELTPDRRLRSERALAAAEAALSAGAGTLALRLVANAEVDVLGAVGRGRRLIVEAMCGLYLADPTILRGGLSMLLQAAALLRDSAPEVARRALLLAVNNATVTEDRATDAEIGDLARAIRSLPSADDPASLVLHGVSAFILDPYPDAVPSLRAALAALETLGDEQVLEFAFSVTVPSIALWDWDAASRLLRRVADVGRRIGALREADGALWTLSAVELSRTNPALAATYIDQSQELRRALGSVDDQAVNAALMAWQGVPLPIVEQVTHAINEAGWGGIARMAHAAIAIQEIAAGEYAQAFERLTPLVRHPFMQAGFFYRADYVEAAARSGNLAAARAATDQISQFAETSGSPAALGHLERARALLADDSGAEAHYVESVRLLDTPGHRGDAARTRLLHGEWLRRQRRRSDARIELRSALDTFELQGATAFAERARRELLAAGATAVQGAVSEPLLTAQETEVARLAAAGATNAEIGATLFISANTVDYHLRKVFRKLGVASRRQLADRLADDA